VCLRGRSPREVQDLAMSMIVTLRWPMAAINHHAELSAAMTTPFEAC